MSGSHSLPTVGYLLPDDAALIDLEARLRVAHDPPRRAERRYYDTFDGRVHDAGAALVHENHQVVLERDGRHVIAAGERPPKRITAQDAPALADILDVRAALPVATVRSQVRVLRVLDGEEKTVVRLRVESPAGLSPRLDILPVRGYDKALARVRRLVEEDLGLTEAPETLVDEAVRAAGGIPGGVSSKLDVALAGSARADEAAAAVLVRLIEIIRANLPGTLEDIDTEFLHDLRVAVRRTRAMQRELQGVFPPAPLAAFRAGFKWLQQVTGPTRDLDVYLIEFDDFRAGLPARSRRDLDPVLALLAAHRATEQRRMVRALKSDRADALLSGWEQLVHGLGPKMHGDRPDAARPVADVAVERISKVHKRMVKMGRAIDADSPHEALHDLRKKGKELRYLYEFFGSLFPAKETKAHVKSLKALQDTLGRFQDREVQAEMLRSLREEIAALEDGPAALMAMGLLVERLEEQQEQARAEFDERFAAFAA